MKSEKHIEWENYFKLGITMYRIIPPTVIRYTIDSYLPIVIDNEQEAITFNARFNIAPCLIDKGIQKANRLFKYYTFKQLNGAVIFLGSK